jgi:uncharacterized membrane protein
MVSPTSGSDPVRPAPGRIGSTLRALIRTRVSAGLLVVLPIYITYLIVRFVFEVMRDSSLWVVEWFLRSRWVEQTMQRFVNPAWRSMQTDSLSDLPIGWQWGIWMFAVFLTVFILYFIGLLTANMLGRRLVGAVELVLERLPLVKTVYRASKQILTTFASEHRQNFQRVAIFPFLHENCYTVGFVTNSFIEPRTGEEYVTLFYATSPNPTTGYFLILRRRDVLELDWSMEEAVRAVISAGILLPSNVPVPLGDVRPGVLVPPGLPQTQLGPASGAAPVAGKP